MKNKFLIIFSLFGFLLFPKVMFSEIVTLEDCLRSFEKNSTSEQKVQYYEAIKKLEKDNFAGEYLPKLNLVGQISYQSETIKLPFSSPLFPIKEIPRDQYYTALELDQLVFDGFAISNSRKISDKKFNINELSTKVESQKIKESIVKLYFSILLLQKQKEINLLVTQDLISKRKQFESMLANGVILKSDFNQIEIEILRRKEDLSKIESDLKTLNQSLKTLTKIENTSFELAVPNEKQIDAAEPGNRPEHKLLTESYQNINLNKSLINSNYYPKISAFAKFGYANPNPNNFFKVDFSTFYNVGIRLKFEIFDWNKNSRSKEILEQNQKILNEDKENFNRNFEIQIIEEKNNIQKYSELVSTDTEILKLQKEILTSAYSQLSNGTITMAEYINQFNNLERTQVNIEVNNILKLNSIYNYLIKSNQLTY